MPSAGGFRKSSPYATLLTIPSCIVGFPCRTISQKSKGILDRRKSSLQCISSVSATALSPFRFTQMFVFPKRASCHRAGSVTGGFFFPFVTIGSEQLLTFRKWPPAFSAHPRRWSCRQREYGPAAILSTPSSHHLWGNFGYRFSTYFRFMNLVGFTYADHNPDSWEGWHWGGMHMWGFS